MQKRKYNFIQGFTLIELMVVTAIVAILGAIALNSYRHTVLDSRRGEAKAALMALAQAQANYRVTNISYADDATLNALVSINDTEAYDYAVATSTSFAFTITADPSLSTVGQNEDECGELTIDEELLIISNTPTCSDIGILYTS